jgi:protease I
MGRLTAKNILIVIPKDYYNEKELDPILEALKKEGTANIRIASSKFKEAVGMKNGRIMPDVMIVDAVEGLVGDSYVTGGSGTRQVRGVFHGVILIGGSGAKRYLWEDNILRLLLTDRHSAGFVVAAIGLGVPCLGFAGLLEGLSVAVECTKESIQELEKAKALVVEDDVVANDRVITGRDASAVKPFIEAVIAAVEKTARNNKS